MIPMISLCPALSHSKLPPLRNRQCTAKASPCCCCWDYICIIITMDASLLNHVCMLSCVQLLATHAL